MEEIREFKAISDKSVYEVRSDDGLDPLVIISGYDLRVVFNMDRISSLDDAEFACGKLAELFAKCLLDQLITTYK